MSQGWDESAQAWIRSMGPSGDWGRKYVLDAPMLDRVANRGFETAIDLGCGEGRFCRQLQALGVAVVGIDPTTALIEQARRCDPRGDYRVMRAESLDLPNASFDLAVAYLSLIDIPDLERAIAEVDRVLRPGGTFLIANLQSFNTASVAQGWMRETDGTRRFCIDRYFEERPIWSEWQGIRIQNWHRPMRTYLQALLGAGFSLIHFDEPEPRGIEGEKADRYRRVPNFLVMEWKKGV